jgi:hypothetical protein
MSIIVLTPTPRLPERVASTAPRLTTLAGTTIALLDNAKKNVTPFLDHLEAMLRAEYGVAAVVRARKRNQNAPAPPELIAELAGSDAAVSAVGD